MDERLGIAGSGTIACGLAATAAAQVIDVVLWARSEESATRATKQAGAGVRVVTDVAELAEATFLVEAVAEDPEIKGTILAALAAHAGRETVLATTTSSLAIAPLAERSGLPDRFCGLHVFNPVRKMRLVELAFPPEATPAVRERARALCGALGKEAVEVPDIPGFVVNRLLFPFLFAAVDLLAETGLPPESIDACVKLGAGHPMGPLALLDLVGLDVAVAIGDAIGIPAPERLRALVAEGALGRKTKRGLLSYR